VLVVFVNCAKINENLGLFVEFAEKEILKYFKEKKIRVNAS
jgi:hypothetical protein